MDFVDVLDPSRVVRPDPGPSKGRQVLCRVYWREQVNGKEVRVFGGVVPIAKNLFLTGEETDNRDQKIRIGFVPEGNAPPAPSRAKRPRKPKVRPEDRRRDEDED